MNFQFEVETAGMDALEQEYITDPMSHGYARTASYEKYRVTHVANLGGAIAMPFYNVQGQCVTCVTSISAQQKNAVYFVPGTAPLSNYVPSLAALGRRLPEKAEQGMRVIVPQVAPFTNTRGSAFILKNGLVRAPGHITVFRDKEWWVFDTSDPVLLVAPSGSAMVILPPWCDTWDKELLTKEYERAARHFEEWRQNVIGRAELLCTAVQRRISLEDDLRCRHDEVQRKIAEFRQNAILIAEMERGVRRGDDPFKAVRAHPLVQEILTESQAGTVFAFVLKPLHMYIQGRKYPLPSVVVRITLSPVAGDVRIEANDSTFAGYSGLWGSSQVHPHVDTYGSPCLGNAGGLLVMAAQARDYGQMVELIVRYLQQVDPDDSAGAYYLNWPYVTEDGHEIIEGYGPLTECSECGALCSDEEIYSCARCGDPLCEDCYMYAEHDYYCPSCYARDFVACGKCDTPVRKEDVCMAQTDTGETVHLCENCCEHYTFSCAACGETFFTHGADSVDMTEVSGGDTVCPGCLADMYKLCSNCDIWYECTEAQCPECGKEEGNGNGNENANEQE